MDRLPNFRRHGAPFVRAKPATILVLDLCPFLNKTNMNKINKEKGAVTVVYNLLLLQKSENSKIFRFIYNSILLLTNFSENYHNTGVYRYSRVPSM